MLEIGIFTAFPVIFLILGVLKFLGNGKLRQQNIPCQFIGLYFVGNFHGVGNGFREILKDGFHLLDRFKVIFLIGQAIAITAPAADGRRLLFAVLDTEQNIVGIGLLLS